MHEERAQRGFTVATSGSQGRLPPLAPGAVPSASTAIKLEASDLVVGSVRTNRIAIVLSVASLAVLIDEKLAFLHDQRPNNAETQAARDKDIALYKSLKRKVKTLRDVTLELESGKPGKVREQAVETAANRFVRGVQNWWNKGHEKICDKAFDAAIFASCVLVCELAGCGGSLAVTVSGVLVSGKPMVEALRTLSKRLR